MTTRQIVGAVLFLGPIFGGVVGYVAWFSLSLIRERDWGQLGVVLACVVALTGLVLMVAP